jgi:hypothetical protein
MVWFDNLSPQLVEINGIEVNRPPPSNPNDMVVSNFSLFIISHGVLYKEIITPPS